MWSRAVWVEKGGKEEEGVIPSSWIEGHSVRWPKVFNAARYIQNCAKPDNSWHLFKLIKTKVASGTFVQIKYVHLYNNILLRNRLYFC